MILLLRNKAILYQNKTLKVGSNQHTQALYILYNKLA